MRAQSIRNDFVANISRTSSRPVAGRRKPAVEAVGRGGEPGLPSALRREPAAGVTAAERARAGRRRALRLRARTWCPRARGGPEPHRGRGRGPQPAGGGSRRIEVKVAGGWTPRCSGTRTCSSRPSQPHRRRRAVLPSAPGVGVGLRGARRAWRRSRCSDGAGISRPQPDLRALTGWQAQAARRTGGTGPGLRRRQRVMARRGGEVSVWSGRAGAPRSPCSPLMEDPDDRTGRHRPVARTEDSVEERA
ncbi:hypothetical protein QJS66_09570 [Kocuria rhizophila]|nr:hypothetical protein QJS66_09570 [Kocuria rhizophila]